MTKNKRYRYLSYNQIANRIDAIVPSVREGSYDALVVIVRGGNFPGTHLSIRTGLPVHYLSYQRKESPPTVNWVGLPPSGKKVLLVEDMAGAGKTLTSCKEFLEYAYEVNTFVVFKDTKSSSIPDFFCFETSVEDEAFLLPWEKTKVNPYYDIMDKSKRFVDHELEFTVWNLNCYLSHDSVTGFERRSITPLYLMGENDVLLMEESKEELELMEWLEKEPKFYPLHVVHFPDYEETNMMTQALEIGNSLSDIGCTRYVDNNLERLVLIHQCYPYLETLWWNNGNPISIHTSAV